MDKVILLMGPTCAGKTEAAIALAKTLGTEIISADSMQIYRHMDIGTGKPPAEKLEEVRHHMMDIVEPSEDYSAGRYADDAAPIIASLIAGGKVPVVTGGTGLYMRALTRGLFSGPSADTRLREELLKTSPEDLYGRLSLLDPVAAEGIMPNDLRRIVRALEVCIKSGKKVSELRERLTVPLPYEFIKIGLTRERGELYRMIEERVERMLQEGLLDEVRKVLSMRPSKTAMQAIGYKEMAAHIEGHIGLDEAKALIKRNTKRYARRQLIWLRKEEGIRWVDATGLTAHEVLSRIHNAIGGGCERQ